MSLTYCIEKHFNWEEGTVKELENHEGEWHLFIDFKPFTHGCVHCHHDRLYIKDYRNQKVLLGHWNSQPIFGIIHKRRYLCGSCRKTFYEPIPGIGRYQRRSQDVIRRIQKACAELISFKTIAKMQGISVSTVIRYFDRLTIPTPKQLPEILSLDEFRENARGQRYQVAVNNPRTHEILDILPNRNTLEMIHYFSRFPRKERMKVKFVVMDLSALFRRVVQTMFPYATIIGDRFHVQRLVIWALERVRKKVQNHFREKRIYFKRNKHILNKKGTKLTSEEFDRLHEILKQSPELQRAYALKEAFFNVFSMKYSDSVKQFLTQWLKLVEESGVSEFNSVLKTFKDWRQAILNGLTQVYSNGFTEGMNNKIKVLKRVAFGFRNFERFRARILWTSLRN